MIDEAIEHEDAVALLPWLVNGTLGGDERERVERHVRGCLPCRTELTEQLRLRALVQRQPVVPMSADAGFERLRARLDRQPRRRVLPRRGLWALAATVGVAAIGWTIAATVLRPSSPLPAAEYRTLSGPRASTGLVDVIFAEGVRESDMRELLEQLDAEIVAGPSRTLGRYTLRIPTANGAPDVEAIVATLLDDERVRFAGPTFSPPASDAGAGDAATSPGADEASQDEATSTERGR